MSGRSSFYDFEARPLDGGADVSMGHYKNKVILVVNTASKCGFTPQYAGLEMLYREYEEKGFVVLGFPCNQFGSQEPGNHAEIASFCEKEYEVSFPMFEKVHVNGKKAHPLFTYLKQAMPGLLGKKIAWNFTKFLIGRDGVPVKRFGATSGPSKIEQHVKTLL